MRRRWSPGHGVRFQANFADDVAGAPATGGRWLRLTRTGSVVDGYESADGAAWRRVGTVDLGDLPPTVQVGLFVTSPDAVRVTRQFGSVGIGGHPTASTATFDNVRVAPAGSPPASWADRDGLPSITSQLDDALVRPCNVVASTVSRDSRIAAGTEAEFSVSAVAQEDVRIPAPRCHETGRVKPEPPSVHRTSIQKPGFRSDSDRWAETALRIRSRNVHVPAAIHAAIPEHHGDIACCIECHRRVTAFADAACRRCVYEGVGRPSGAVIARHRRINAGAFVA